MKPHADETLGSHQHIQTQRPDTNLKHQRRHTDIVRSGKPTLVCDSVATRWTRPPASACSCLRGRPILPLVHFHSVRLLIWTSYQLLPLSFTEYPPPDPSTETNQYEHIVLSLPGSSHIFSNNPSRPRLPSPFLLCLSTETLSSERAALGLENCVMSVSRLDSPGIATFPPRLSQRRAGEFVGVGVHDLLLE